MDEIICPECGRPNLAEAEKCWYCQVPLVKSDGDTGQSEKTLDSADEKSGSKVLLLKSPVAKKIR